MIKDNGVTDHTITVFHNGNEIHILFDSEESKTKYIKAEWAYCNEARNNYMGGNTPKEDVKEYLKKRFEYAILCGFRETTTNKYRWRIQDERQENQTA